MGYLRPHNSSDCSEALSLDPRAKRLEGLAYMSLKRPNRSLYFKRHLTSIRFGLISRVRYVDLGVHGSVPRGPDVILCGAGY